MATTTSTQDSGLLEYLLPIFKSDTGLELKWLSTGTGKALEHGKSCDVEVLLVHAPAAELKFVAEGFGVDRRQVMYNDFVIVGPADDPAGIKGKDAKTALKELSGKEAQFISRGDNSGTHQAELALWKQVDITPPEKDSWYLSIGQGMGAVLSMTSEKRAYTLADRGTYIKMKALEKPVDLVILSEGDKDLFNQYSVIAVNPERCPHVAAKKDAVRVFMDWWVSEKAQKAISDYRLEGQPLFFPNAGK
jgi:tungstate transport system substrate-binding protein